MSKAVASVLGLVSLICVSCESVESAQAEPSIPAYDGSWEALQQMPVPDWFEDGKVGIFIHWGPYSEIGFRRSDRGYAEHVPSQMYKNPKYYYPRIKERWGQAPPEFGYKDIVERFEAEHWDPEGWAELFQEAGATYVIMTAEHHDGWANWDSELTPWNAMDKGPKRDLVGELGVALRKRGLKYGPSTHRERHTMFFGPHGFKVHGEPHPDIAEEIRRNPEAASLYGPFSLTREFTDDFVARWQEIQAKYQPDFLWMDDVPIFTRDGNDPKTGFKPEVQYYYDACRAMITDFMNDAASRGQAVYVNNKGKNRNWPDGVGCLEKDNLNLKVIGPKWQSCTTMGTSYGYLAAEEAEDYPHRKRSVAELVHLMVQTVSRNGNFLVNIGPRGDGTIPEWQVERLRGLGEWLNVNGEAIYGTRYWTTHTQDNEQLSFTTRGTTLYAIKCSPQPPREAFTIEADPEWADAVVSVKLLGSGAEVAWTRGEGGLTITPPEDVGLSQHAWAFAIETTREQYQTVAGTQDADRAFGTAGH